jgi:4-coumarate--CoA ligase
MPTKSSYPELPIPDTDLWGFLFERKDKPYPDDKGRYLFSFCLKAFTNKKKQ